VIFGSRRLRRRIVFGSLAGELGRWTAPPIEEKMPPAFQTFEVPYPEPDRVEAVAIALRASGRDPRGEGSLGELLQDLMMILGSRGAEREVADYLRTTDGLDAPARPIAAYAELANRIVRAYHGDTQRPAV
jgi:hypothetical protein